MAGGPYTDSRSGAKYIIWDQKPLEKPVSESLKTKSAREASQRKDTLETLFRWGRHRPDKQRWYYNPNIRHIVEDGLLDLQALASDGQDQVPHVTIHEGVREYVRHKRSQRGRKGWKTRRTVSTHRQTLRQFRDFVGADRAIESLEEKDLDRFYQRPGFESDYTKKSARARVNAMIKWWVGKGYLPEYIDAEVDQPQTEVKRYVRQQTMEEIFEQMERQAEKDLAAGKHLSGMHSTAWYADFCRVAYDTGLRGIELIQLRTSDITPSDILVGNSFRVKTNFQRKVAIGDGIARGVLDRYTDPEFRAEDAYLAESPYLWGRSSQSTRARITTALKEASLAVAQQTGGLGLQDLRHLSAMRWLMLHREQDEGFRLVLLMRRLGHKQLNTTQRYLNFLPSDGVV